MDYTNKKITLDDGKVYAVIEQVEYDNGIYLYIVNLSNENDSEFVEIRDNDILNIDPELFTEKIFPLFKEKFSN